MTDTAEVVGSEVAGYLTPLGWQQAQDVDLDGIIQGLIVGVLNMSGSLVRPKWQAGPPAQPARDVNWCAFGVNVTNADVNPTLIHDGQADCGKGLTTELRCEYLEVTASFYGPACRSYASALRDALGIAQNRDMLRASGLKFNQIERLTLVPDLTNTQWIRRADLVMRMSRTVERTYAIRNVVSVSGAVVTGQGAVASLSSSKEF